MNLRVILLLVAIALVTLGIWLTWARPFHRPRSPRAQVSAPAQTKSEVPIQDGKTIDFSSGRAQVKDDAKEKAVIAKSVADMNEAAANVTFSPKATPPGNATK